MLKTVGPGALAATLLSILSQMLVVSLLFSLRIQIGVIKMFPMQMSAILGVEVKLGFSRKTLANSASADDIAQRQEKG